MTCDVREPYGARRGLRDRIADVGLDLGLDGQVAGALLEKRQAVLDADGPALRDRPRRRIRLRKVVRSLHELFTLKRRAWAMRIRTFVWNTFLLSFFFLRTEVAVLPEGSRRGRGTSKDLL